MTLEQQVHSNDVKLRKALDRIQVLEEAMAKLVAIETDRLLAVKAFSDFEALRDEASSQTGHDM